MCCLKGRKYIQILLDIFPEGLVRIGKLNRKSAFVRIWSRLFIYSLNNTDRVIVIGRDMKAWIETLTTSSEKLFYIPLWQDDKMISPFKFDENEIVAQYGLNNNFIVQYSGNMGLWNEMETIGKAVLQKPPGVMFMFIGNGMRKKELLDSMDMKIPENVLMLPFQVKENFRKSITACHAALVSLSGGLEGMAVPSKMFGIMAAGVPVVAIVPSESEIAMIIRETKCGIIVDPGDYKTLNDAILLLKSDEIERRNMGENGRKAFLEKYTTRRIAQQYKALIEALA
jgi:glycosyltransferase involved in cell wall biosynthesis